ncbi:DHHA1 domain-containing protein [Candidatus Micrarchaeota archaeon]|nr:DHHA1 domain-containing protein [Candidatus Micrarchaeota archaeon]
MEKAGSEVFRDFLSRYCGRKVAIATHNRADADGIASAYALSRALPGSVICTDEEMNEGARLLCEKLGIRAVPLATLERKDFEGLIVVDTSAFTLVPNARGWKLLCIIDHHRPDGRDMKGEFEIIDPESPSASEIVAGIVPEADIAGKEAFALSVGIIADAARFKSARARTFDTLGRLMRICGAEYRELLELAEPDPKPEAKLAMLTAMKRVEFVYAGGYIIATTEVGSNESDAASLIADAADVCFVAKWKDSENATRISARARKTVHVPLNEVMAEVAGELGGAGGGHAKAAGASLKAHTAESLKTCVEVFISMAGNAQARR